MRVHSVLKKAKKENISRYPFPHIIIENALDEDLYCQLEKEYPFETKIEGNSGLGSNIRHQISAVDGLREDSRLSNLWKEFVDYHTSYSFYKEVYDLFSADISEKYPFILREASTGVLYRDSADIFMDCQPGVNTPVTDKSSVKISHIDNPTQIYASLLYFRDDKDDSSGGDLELYKYASDKYRFHGPRLIKQKYVEATSIVPYKKNTFVIFLNSINSIHGVTPRGLTKYQRRLVNIIGSTGKYYENDKKLFEIPRIKSNIFKKGISFIYRKIN
jgi:hypothetical protein